MKYLWLLDDEKFVSSRHKIFYLQKHYPDILEEFNLIKFKEQLPFMQLFWHFLYDDIDLKMGICPMCGKRCKFEWRKIRGYRHHCSPECWKMDEEYKNRQYDSLSELWKNKPQEEIDERYAKSKETFRRHYGKDNYSQTEDHTNKCRIAWSLKTDEELQDIEKRRGDTKELLYGNRVFNNGDKISQTLLSKGELFWSERKEKIKRTSIERYGEDFYMKTDEYKQRIQNTWDNKPQEEIDDMVKRCKETTLKLYGVESYSMTQECRDKTKQTCLEKYGVENYSQTQEYQDRMKQTCLEKYGVESYSQTNEFASKRRKRIEYNNLTFDSSWEVVVYQYYQKNNISCEYQPEVNFEYYYNGEKHYYQPDFLIDGKLYEVKGDQFFDGDKMINPYDRNQDDLFEAKHQCMISNNVIILRGDDIKKMRDLL